MSRKNKVNIPDDLKQKCNVIIHGASTASAAACAGIAQIPLADNAVLAPIQVTMIVSIAKVFDQNIGEGVARGLLSTFAATFVGRGVTQVLFGWVPGFGNAVNSITAAALTEAIGWMAVDHFAKGYQLDQKAGQNFTMAPGKAAEEQAQARNLWKEDFEKRVLAALKRKEPSELNALVNEFDKKELELGLPADDPLRQVYMQILEARC